MLGRSASLSACALAQQRHSRAAPDSPENSSNQPGKAAFQHIPNESQWRHKTDESKNEEIREIHLRSLREGPAIPGGD